MSSCGIKRIVKFDNAEQFHQIRVFDGSKSDITTLCSYSWSSDNECWTNWTDYNNYVKSCKHINSDFYTRILISSDLSRIVLGNKNYSCYHICLDNTNTFLQSFCDQPNLYQPYSGLDCALQLQQQLSDSVVCTLGLPIYYLRVQPREESVDYTFKEFSLHDIVDIKQIKMMVPDGQMPSSNPKLTDFDFDWETDWEVELGKSQFARAFGNTISPKQRDLIYVPLMKRLWEVNSAYDEKNEGLMWRPTTWKLSLVKYNEKTNVEQGPFENIIDEWTVNKYEDIFGYNETEEQEHQTGSIPVESPQFAADNTSSSIYMSDAVRANITGSMVTISQSMIYHRHTILARNAYQFATDQAKVTYQKGQCGENGSISFIIGTPLLSDSSDRTIIQFGTIPIHISAENGVYNIQFDTLVGHLEPGSIYMIHAIWNRDTFSTGLNAYKYTVEGGFEGVPEYMIKPEMHSFDFENPVFQLTGTYNNDFALRTRKPCSVSGWPCSLTNIKYYDKALSYEDIIKESLKYTTTHPNCVINDLARPLTDGLGYPVK